MNKGLRERRGQAAVSSQLRELALAKGAGNKLPTVDELCVALGTSRGTLDNALNDLESRNIVLRKRGSGIYVSPKIGYKSIAIVFSQDSGGENVSSPFWGMLQDMLWRSASDRAARMEQEYTFHFIPAGTSREESAARKSFEDLLASGNVDGVLCVQPGDTLQLLMHTLGIPVVGYALGYDSGWGVSYDILEMFRLGADQLIQQGCRRIRLIPAHSVVLQTQMQIAEICRRMEPPITYFRGNTLDNWQYEPANHQDFGQLAATEIFGADNAVKPDGLVVLDDMVADGIIKTLLDMDIRPGRDVKIATHGNTGSPILNGWQSRLTIIESDPARLVESMFDLLDSVLSGRRPARKTISLPWAIRLHGTILPAD